MSEENTQSVSSQPTSDQFPAEKEAPKQRQKQKNKGLDSKLLMIVAIVVFLAIVGAVFFVNQDDQDTDNEGQTADNTEKVVTNTATPTPTPDIIPTETRVSEFEQKC